MGRCILLDCHSILQPMRWAARKNLMFNGSGNDNFIVALFLQNLAKYAFQFGTNQFLFAWDSRESIRRQHHPWYKEKRKEKPPTEEEAACDTHSFWQINMLQEDILPTIGFIHNHHYAGYEADDIIAAAVMNNKGAFTIISRDEDLFQLLPYANLWRQDNRPVMTERTFEVEFGINASRWWEVKAIAGCKSDTIEGIRGVGTKTAIKYIQEQLGTKTNAYANIVSEHGKEIARRNEWLVRLPLYDCPIPDLDYTDKRLSLEGFRAIADKYALSELMYENDRRLFKQRMNLQ